MTRMIITSAGRRDRMARSVTEMRRGRRERMHGRKERIGRGGRLVDNIVGD